MPPTRHASFVCHVTKSTQLSELLHCKTQLHKHWRWRQQAPPKRRSLITNRQGERIRNRYLNSTTVLSSNPTAVIDFGLVNFRRKSKVVSVEAVMAHRRSGGIAPLILSLRTGWKGLARITLRPIYPLERVSSTFWTEGWMGPELVWAFGKRYIACPWLHSNSGPSIQQPGRYTDNAVSGSEFLEGGLNSEMYT
jgi:hypothetical protein